MRTVFVPPTAAEQPQYSPSIPTCLQFPNFRHPPDTRECIHSGKVEAFTFFEVNGVDHTVDFTMCIIFTPPREKPT